MPRRNSTSNHRRPSSAPGDNQADLRPLSTNGLDDHRPPQLSASRPSKPPLLRSRSDHPSRRRDTSADSSNDDQTIVATGEDFGARHGFEGDYHSEDIISQLANVSCPFSVLPITSPFRFANVPDMSKALYVYKVFACHT